MMPPRPPLEMRRLLWRAAMALLVTGGVQAAPPTVNFRLQWRLVPWPPAPVTQGAPGGLTVGTAALASPPPGSVTTRTAPPADDGPPELLVRNGGQARIAWQRDDREVAPDWVWSAAFGPGLHSRVRRLSQRDALWVQVRWPGGAALAELGFRFEQPRDGARPAAGTQQIEGELLVALGAWQQVGHWASADGRGQALELRLSRLP